MAKAHFLLRQFLRALDLCWQQHLLWPVCALQDPMSCFSFRLALEEKRNAKARISAAIPKRSLQAVEQQTARCAVFNAAAP
jgi:hypothetical protein